MIGTGGSAAVGLETAADADDPDAAARRAIESDLDVTFFVEAGAGTGKTTSLVRRIVSLVAGRVARMRDIAAITFTEAAAAELRERVRSEIERSVRTGEVSPDALSEVDDAAICTLHAFALLILKEHSFEAGLPPAIEILDDAEVDVEFDRSWRELLGLLMEAPEYEELFLFALALGLRLEKLRSTAADLRDDWDRLARIGYGDDTDAGSSTLGTNVDVSLTGLAEQGIAQVVESIRDAVGMADRCSNDSDLLYSHLMGLRDFADWIDGSSGIAPEPAEILSVVAKRSIRCSKGVKHNWSCPVVEVRDACGVADDARRQLVDSVVGLVVRDLIRVLADFSVKQARDRQREGRLIFHDLLVLACELARGNPSVRAEIASRFTHLLVDEFQDTDPLQVELVYLLASGTAPTDAGIGDDFGGRLFFVGDGKQSIYRFRRADVELFESVSASVARRVVLSRNYRSVPGVLEWVNLVFGELLGSGVEGSQPPYEPLSASRERVEGCVEPPVVLLGGGEEARISEVREVEAADVVRTMKRVVQEGWPVALMQHEAALGSFEASGAASGVRDASLTRPARWGDIALLLPTRVMLSQIEASLDAAGVPYKIEGVSFVWRSQDVVDLVNILKAIDDPSDEVSVVAALRSSFLACADDDLVRFRASGGRWDPSAPLPDGISDDSPVAVAMRLLDEMHDARLWTPSSQLLEQIVRRLGLFELILGYGPTHDRWERMRWVLDQARWFEDSGHATLGELVKWMARQMDQNSRSRLIGSDDADRDAVRILTIHGSKGLEFPVVFLAGLNVADRVVNPPVLWASSGMPSLRLDATLRSGDYDELAEQEARAAHYEKLRLLYVAATRARDYLLVSVHHASGTRSQAAKLVEVCEERPQMWRRIRDYSGDPVQGQPAPALSSERSGPSLELSPGLSPEQRNEWLAQRGRLVSAMRSAPWFSATALAALEPSSSWRSLHSDLDQSGTAGSSLLSLGSPASDVMVMSSQSAASADYDSTEELPSWDRVGVGASIGRAVHAVLEKIDLSDPRGIREAALASAAHECIPAHAEDVDRMARAALDTTVVRRARSLRHWREVYVAAPIGKGVLEGFIDLLIEGPDGMEIVDYKTDRLVTDRDVEAAVSRYSLQMAAYAVAIESSLGASVSQCVLVFLGGGQAREKVVSDLEVCKREVHERLKR